MDGLRTFHQRKANAAIVRAWVSAYSAQPYTTPTHKAEWLTRKSRIDTKLRSLNPRWQIVRYHDDLDLSTLYCVAVEEFPTANGPPDYALFVNGLLLGFIEAKKTKVNPQNVLEQAKRYAQAAFQVRAGSLHEDRTSPVRDEITRASRHKISFDLAGPGRISSPLSPR